MSRPHGVTVELIDLQQHEVYATDAARSEGMIGEAQRLQFAYGPYALMRCTDGDVWLVCSEGVGWPVDGEVKVDLYSHTEDDESRMVSFSAYPTVTIALSLHDLQNSVTGETADLADHVRVFGDRLDRNVWSLYDRATMERANA